MTDNEFGCHQYNWLGDWAIDNCNELCSETDECNATIPNQIGYLTNLEGLWLFNNQLTGTIPESICNLTLNFNDVHSFYIHNNQLCPPYPSCVEDYVVTQDTSGCN